MIRESLVERASANPVSSFQFLVASIAPTPGGEGGGRLPRCPRYILLERPFAEIGLLFRAFSPLVAVYFFDSCDTAPRNVDGAPARATVIAITKLKNH